MKYCITTLLFIAAITNTWGQGVADWWYFGTNAGLHFTSAGPVAVTNGQLITNEGCASISDYNGNLLFYTDGSIVYNAAHAVMTNGSGLLGNSSSANSAIIVPKPGNPDIYYIVCQSNNQLVGITYSVVDMTLSSGLGAVVATQKNIPLLTGTRENITAVRHSNGLDFWVVTHMFYSYNFASFLITSAGINTTPVVSVTTSLLGATQPTIKTSPDGKYVCISSDGGTNSSGSVLGKFNTQTGQVTQAFRLPLTGFTPYGVEFSPNSKVLYTSPRLGSTGSINQYDLSVYDSATIASSLYVAASGVRTAAMQLGPDRKIYCATNTWGYMHCIQDPDSLGAACNFQADAIYLSGKMCRQGLPNFISSWFVDIDISQFCVNDSTYFVADSATLDSVFWDFGDPGSTDNEAEGFDVAHLFSDTGQFEVSIITYSDTFADTTARTVYIYPRQEADLGIDTALCVNDTMVLNATQDYSTYLWSTNDTTAAIEVTQTDEYIVTVFGVCDTVLDTVWIEFFQPFFVDLGPDTAICIGDTLAISPELGTALTFSWSTNDEDSVIYVSDTGTYSVTVNDTTCAYSDTVHMAFYPPLEVDLGNDSVFCYIPSAHLVPFTENTTAYQWSTGATTPSIPVSITDTYGLTVTDGHCFKSDSVAWYMFHDPIATLGRDTAFCPGDFVKLTSGLEAPIEFLWNTGETTANIDASVLGLYWVMVSDSFCSMRDSIIIDEYPELGVTLGPDQQACAGDSLVLVPIATDTLVSFLWSDGSQGPALGVGGHGTYYVTVSNGFCLAGDDMNVFYFEYPALDLGPDTTYCLGTTVDFDITSWDIATYMWSDGFASPQREEKIDIPVSLWAEVTNVVCTTRDSVFLGIHPDPMAGLPNEVALCADSFVTLSAQVDSTYRYTWSTQDTTSQVVVYKPGSYTVSVSDGKCASHTTVDVVPSVVPEIKLEAPQYLCEAEEVIVDASTDGIQYYRWSDGFTQRSIVVGQPGIYSVEGFHPCGVARDTLTIFDCECRLWFPSAFHPNGDGLNDVFGATLDCDLEKFSLRIFDRWGHLIFASEQMDRVWNGNAGEAPAQVGAYTWMVDYTFNLEGTRFQKTETGSVLLLR